MNLTPDAQKVDALFREKGKQHFWVLEYSITHHFMRAAIHKGDYPRCTIVELDDCLSFAGSLQGGPYALALRQEPTEEGDVLVVTGDESRLVVKCGGVRIVRVRE